MDTLVNILGAISMTFVVLCFIGFAVAGIRYLNKRSGGILVPGLYLALGLVFLLTRCS